MLKKLVVLLFPFALYSCTSDVEIHAPDNGIISLCSQGMIGNTRVSCATPGTRIASAAQGNTALIVFIEPGDYNSNIAQADESVRIVANSIPADFAGIKPHLRQIMINLAVGHLKFLVNTYGSRYDHIYLLRSDVAWTASSMALTFKNVLTYNKTVDILLQIHGSPGAVALDSSLSRRMTVADLNNMKSTLSLAQRERVRSIINTACYSASNGYYSGVYSSIAQSLVSLFPRATTYGGYGINYGAIHRDMVTFENYYARGWDFYYSASYFSNLVMTRTIASGYSAPRSTLPFPVFTVRGQARYFGFTKTEWQTVKLPALSFTGAQHDASRAYLFYGASSGNTSIYSRYGDRYAETDTRAPSAYLAPALCLYQGRFLNHGTVFSEYEYVQIGSAYDGYQQVNEYRVSCYDGAVSRVYVQPPPPPPQDPWYGGGY